jgi:O-antigen ligase
MALLSLLVLFYVGIVLTGSRGALLAVILLATWVACYRLNYRAALKVVYVLVVLGAIAISAGWTDPLLRLGANSRERGDLNGRLVLWPIARREFSNHFWLGNGHGTFRGLNPLGFGAHNALLEFGVGLGVCGIVLFVLFLYFSLIQETRALADGRQRALILGAVLSVSAPILLSGQWDQSPVAWLLFAIVSRVPVLGKERLQKGSESPSLGMSRPGLAYKGGRTASLEQSFGSGQA